MKEYIAETGGRYTYSDDILNLQELALSTSAIFEGCSNFIVSGCEISGTQISSGLVWINGKVRHFSGCTDAVFPYYIYEKNHQDTVTYANEVNKRGRCNYLCLGTATVPTVPDGITGLVPEFIELKPDYSPRFIDKFFGKYAVLLETPFAKQTVKKELVLAGKLSGDKELESKTAVSVINPSNGYCLRNSVKANGDASVGVYASGLLVSEIVIKTDGRFSFIRQGQEITQISDSGIRSTYSFATTAQIGSMMLYGAHIINTDNLSDEGAVSINAAGYQNGNTKFRNFNVYNGKSTVTALFQVIGKTESATVNALFQVNNTGRGMVLSNKTYPKADKRLINTLSWTDNAQETIAFLGYDTNNSFDFTCKNTLGNIIIHSNGFVNIVGELKIGGIGIGNLYVTQTTFNTELGKKVTSISGKGLSSEDFTTEYRNKLEAITSGSLSGTGNGYALAAEVRTELAQKLTKADNLSDLADKAVSRTNLSVYSMSESDSKFSKIGDLFQDYVDYLKAQGKTTAEALTILRDKLGTSGKEEVVNNYLRKDSKLSDLVLANADAQKLACQKLGAAYAADYQAKLMDSGWVQMSNSGNGTDTRNLFVRQIGNMVCIQGTINTGKKNGSNWGGTVAVIPNPISPPRYGLRVSYADWNDNTIYNRGASFIIRGNTRQVLIYERGWVNITTEIHFTYMT